MVQWTGFVAVIVALGLLYVWQQIQTRDMKRDILLLEARKTQLIQENSRLHVEVSRRSTQNRVESVASNVLELEYPMIGQVVSVTDESSTSVMVASLPEYENSKLTVVMSSKQPLIASGAAVADQ